MRCPRNVALLVENCGTLQSLKVASGVAAEMGGANDVSY